jgi:uncharacterized protein (TIGR00369 family)
VSEASAAASPPVDPPADAASSAPPVPPDLAATPDDTVALLNATPGELNARMGITIIEATPERVVGTMPVEGNRQPYGLLHGGASAVLAETVGSVAATLTAGPDAAAVGIEINATHHRAVTSGTVTATATRLHAGRTVATFDIRIVDESGRPVCSCRLSCMFRPRPPAGGRSPGAE